MDDDAMTPFGELIERARQLRGLSQREAAARANVSEGYWRQIKKGYRQSREHRETTNASPQVLARMALAVGVPLDRAGEAAGKDLTPYADVLGETDQDVELVRSLPIDDAAKERIIADILSRRG